MMAWYIQRHINAMQYDARYIQRHINKLQYDGTVHTTSINTLPNVVRYTERQIS